jgi:hypothetical protein
MTNTLSVRRKTEQKKKDEDTQIEFKKKESLPAQIIV